MIKENIEKKTWNEFRETGLFLFINSILHAFGWVIVVEVDGDQVTGAYPARTKFRGFDNEVVEQSHERIAKYLAENAPNFPTEIK